MICQLSLRLSTCALSWLRYVHPPHSGRCNRVRADMPIMVPIQWLRTILKLSFAAVGLSLLDFLAPQRCVCTTGDWNLLPSISHEHWSPCMQMQVMARAPRSGGFSQRAVVRVELVQAKSIWNYNPGPKDTFYKVTVSMPNLVTTARSASYCLFV
jgi:hypothetical protein